MIKLLIPIIVASLAWNIGSILLKEGLYNVSPFVTMLLKSLVFFIILTPIGLILRIFGKDLLKLKKNKKSSYWLSRGDLKSMDRQF